MKIEPGGNVWVDPIQYKRYAHFLHPAPSEKNNAENAVVELQLNARFISQVTPFYYSAFGANPYLADVVFAISEGNVSVEQFEEDLKIKRGEDKFDYRYANLCELLAYCDIKTSWHKDSFLVPGTFYQDERLNRYAIRCSVGKMPMFDPSIIIEIRPWVPQSKIGTGRKIPLIRTEKERRK